MAKKKSKTSPATELHYDKEALLKDYSETFPLIIKVFAAIIAFGLLYFFAMAVYLGGWSHTPNEDMVKQFGGENGRIEYEYEGLRLPSHGGKTIEEQKAELGHH